MISRHELELLIVQMLGEIRMEEQELSKRLSRLSHKTKRPSLSVVTSLAKLDTKLNQLEQMLDALAPSSRLLASAA